MIDRRKLLNLGLGAGLGLAGPVAAYAHARKPAHKPPHKPRHVDARHGGHGHHKDLHLAAARHEGHAPGARHSRRAILAAEPLGPRIELIHPEAVQLQPALYEPRAITLKNLHTDESLEAVYWDGGRYVPDALEAVNKVLRDFRTGDVHPIDPSLLNLLADLRATVGSKAPFQVISGYRSPQTNAMLRERSAEVAQHSFHMDGMAIDLFLDDVALDRLHAAALSLSRGGVGYYPRTKFVHIDVGPVRHWAGA